MAHVRKGDASWVRKLRAEHARQHRAEGGPADYDVSPPDDPNAPDTRDFEDKYPQGVSGMIMHSDTKPAPRFETDVDEGYSQFRKAQGAGRKRGGRVRVRQHKAEGGPVGSFGPDTPANRGRIERERNKAMGEFNTSLPPQPPPLPIKTDD